MRRLFSGFCAQVWERRTYRVHDARIVAEQRHVYGVTYLCYMGTPSNRYTYKYVIWDPRSDCDRNNIEPESLP